MDIHELEQSKFITFVNSATQIDIHILHYGFETTEANKPPVTSGTNFALHFIISGKGFLTIKNKTEKLGKGDIFLLSPTIDMSYKIDSAHPIKQYWISFTGNAIPNLLETIGIPQSDLKTKIRSYYLKKIRQLFVKLFSISENEKNIKELLCKETFWKIMHLIYLSTTNDQNMSTQKEYNESLIEKALQYINNNFTNPNLSLNETAASLYIHKNYLSSLFKKKMGISFKQYLNQQRIQLAINLIQSGKTSIAEIAEQVGIPDTSYFSKVFKKYNNISPHQEILKYININ